MRDGRTLERTSVVPVRQAQGRLYGTKGKVLTRILKRGFLHRLLFQARNHSPAVALDFHKLPGLDGFEGSEASGDKGKEVFETTRLRAKNDDGDLSADQILLVFDALIQGEKGIEFGAFCGCEEVAIFQAGQPSVADSLAVLAGQVIASSLVDTLVDQDAHLGVRNGRAEDVSLLRVRREPLRARP